MNTLILALLIKSWCVGYIESEYGINPQHDIRQELINGYGSDSSADDIQGDFNACIDETTIQEMFNYSYYTSFPDVRI